MKNYEQHEIGQCWPPLSDEEFKNLKAAAHDNPGAKPPVIVYEGKILDGWHWYKACRELQLEPSFEEFTSDQDPTEFVANRHKGRRHLSAHDAAKVASKLAPLRRGAPLGSSNASKNKLKASSEVFNQDTQTEGVANTKQKTRMLEAITGSVGTTAAAVQRYRYYTAHGIPEIAEAADAEKISLSRADIIAHLPKDQQLSALKEALNLKPKKKKKSRIRSRRKTPRRARNFVHPMPEPRTDIQLVQDAWEEWLTRWLYDLAEDLHLTVLIYMKEKINRALKVYHEAVTLGELVGLTRESNQHDIARIKEIMKQVARQNEAA